MDRLIKNGCFVCAVIIASLTFLILFHPSVSYSEPSDTIQVYIFLPFTTPVTLNLIHPSAIKTVSGYCSNATHSIIIRGFWPTSGVVYLAPTPYAALQTTLQETIINLPTISGVPGPGFVTIELNQPVGTRIDLISHEPATDTCGIILTLSRL